MTIFPDTIRTVIEIVPGWKIYEGRYAPLQDEMAETPEGYRFFLTDQILLDYLAAAAVRELDKISNDRNKGFYSHNRGCELYWPGIGHNECGYLIWKGSDRTTITLEAIAEFVKGGGFDD